MTQEPHEFLQLLEDLIFSCKGDKTQHRFSDLLEPTGLKRDKLQQRLRENHIHLRHFNRWCYVKLGARYLREEKYTVVKELCEALQYSEKHYYAAFQRYYDMTPGMYQAIFEKSDEAAVTYVFHVGSWYQTCRHCGGVIRL